MPEVKHSFTQGRMNKDLDERIVPNGEYRDALNIEVATSEGSDVGAVQTTKGNIEVSFKVDDSATCVGILPDEENNAIYYFVHDAKTQEYISDVHGDHTSNGIRTDALLRYNAPNAPNRAGSVDVILSDLHYVKTRHDILQVAQTSIPEANIKVEDLTGICVGMTVNAKNANGSNFWPGTTLPTVASITPASNTVTLNSAMPAVLIGDVAAGVYLEFKHEKALNINVGSYSNISLDNGISGAYETRNVKNKIHSANIIDDLLFWTDNNDEPKKVNVVRAFAGSQDAQDLLSRSNLYVNGTASLGAVVFQGQPYLDKGPIRKDHITVLRPNPTTPLTVELKTSLRDGTTTGTFAAVTLPANIAPGESFAIQDNATLDLAVGDVLDMTGPASEKLIATITEIDTTTTASTTYLTLQINSHTGLTASTSYVFSFILEEDDKLYELKIPRFSYRYRYEDGEYSSYAPFSQPAFEAGAFSLDAEEGQNLGMRNTIRRIILSDWVPNHIPEDVKEIDILYKDSMSPNIYTIETFNRADAEFSADGTGSHDGKFTISTEQLGAALPSNQLIRPWDNVPRKAVTQEVTGNRIIYGNYLQNYDLKDSVADPVDVELGLNINAYSDVPTPNPQKGELSIKSGRKYQLGLVYRDKLGRETPILTNESCTITADKSLCVSNNQLVARINHTPPYWADSFKFYIKEGATEFYNIAIDRLYPCEDEPNNVWISFNSADRNKVEDESLLLLKKVHNGVAYTALRDDYDSEPYKIVSIENNVPESLTKKYKLYQRNNHALLLSGKNGNDPAASVQYNQHNIKGRCNGGDGSGFLELSTDEGWDYTTGLTTHRPNPTNPAGSFQYHAASGSTGGAWEILDCKPMYEDWLANQVELECRITTSGGGTLNCPGNNTGWMKVLSIADVREKLNLATSGTEFAAPVYRIELEAAKDGNGSYIDWWTNNTNGMLLSGQVYRVQFRKVERKIEDEFLGKFFVKLKQKTQPGTAYQFPTTNNQFFNVNGPNATRNSGVFEVLPKRDTDIEIYHEASKAYPVRVNKRTAEQLVNVGDTVKVFGTNNGVTSEIAITAGTVVNSVDADNADDVLNIVLNNSVNLNLASYSDGIEVRFTNPVDNSYVSIDLHESTYSALAIVNALQSTQVTNPQGLGYTVTTAATQGASTRILLTNRIHPVSSHPAVSMKVGLPWFNSFCFGNGVESDRIRDDFNAPTISNGVRASTVFENYEEEHKGTGLIYSGLYNSISGVNDTNQFIQGEKITKDVNPEYGTIQKLHMLDNNLVTICEEKCLKILANKDAVYNADGNPQLVATNRVLGDVAPYAGEFGIGTSPESFANYGFRSYFVDTKRGVVLRLSSSGLTPISEVGMKDWFSDNLDKRTISCYGSFDNKKQEYNISIENILRGVRGAGGMKEYHTLTFSEASQGWTSFKSFLQETGCSLGNNYYTTFKGELFKHHVDDSFTLTCHSQGSTPLAAAPSNILIIDTAVNFISAGFTVSGNGIPDGTTVTSVSATTGYLTLSAVCTVPVNTAVTFTYPTLNYYGDQYRASLTLLLNDQPDAIKSFKTINYEGSQARVLENTSDTAYYNNIAKNGWYVEDIKTDQQEGRVQEFLNKEGKWFNNIQGIKTEWNNKNGIVNATGNVDPREFSVQGIGLAKAISVDYQDDGDDTTPSGPTNQNRIFIYKATVDPVGVAETTNSIFYPPPIGGPTGTYASGLNSIGEGAWMSHGDIGSVANPQRLYEVGSFLQAAVAPLGSVVNGVAQQAWIDTISIRPQQTSVYGGALCVLAKDITLATNGPANSGTYSIMTGGVLPATLTNAASWGNFPPAAAPVIESVVQTESPANGWIHIKKLQGGWLPQEVSHIIVRDGLYRANQFDPANYVIAEVYYNGSGDVGPLVTNTIPPAGTLTQWHWEFDAEGPYGGCWLAAVPLSLSIIQSPSSDTNNSTITITPGDGFETLTSPSRTVTPITGDIAVGVDEPKTVVTITFEANQGANDYYFKDFPTLAIESDAVEDYIIEKLDIEKTVTEIARAEEEETDKKEKGERGRITEEEEKKSEKVSVTDASGTYIIKRIITVKYKGNQPSEGDIITINHSVEQIS